MQGYTSIPAAERCVRRHAALRRTVGSGAAPAAVRAGSVPPEDRKNPLPAFRSAWLLPVYHALHKELLANEILHADETTLMVLREPERQARQRSYVWLYRTSGNALRPVVLYDYQPSRAGVCASRFLEGFSGYLHTDGYEAYHCSLPETVCSVGCWAHMRRKFTDTLRSLPKELRSRAPAQTGLDFCNRLFALEAEFLRQTLSADRE